MPGGRRGWGPHGGMWCAQPGAGGLGAPGPARGARSGRGGEGSPNPGSEKRGGDPLPGRTWAGGALKRHLEPPPGPQGGGRLRPHDRGPGHDPVPQDHFQPPGPPGDLWGGAGGSRPIRSQAQGTSPRLPGGGACRGGARPGDDRDPRGLPPLRGSGDLGPPLCPFPGVAGRTPFQGGDAPPFACSGRHQLRDAGAGASPARLRLRSPPRWTHRGTARPARRAHSHLGRGGACPVPGGAPDHGRREASGGGRGHGWGRHGSVRDNQAGVT